MISLNETQKQAVTPKTGSFLVVAGAGSGKTRIITARIAHLIQAHTVDPHSIVALTFTNKAAKEMKSRITATLGSNNQMPFIGTFHAYCLFLLKRYEYLLSMPTFSVIDEDDKQRLLKHIIDQNDLRKEYPPKRVSYQISHIKNNSIDPLHHELLTHDPRLERLFKLYEKERKASNCFDFDDLLLEVVKLFTMYDEFKDDLQARVTHLLVDEYQDTNIVQHELLKHMALKDKEFIIDSVCVVGDEDQSIYSWRGATITNIMNFKDDFSKTKIIMVEQNYRSVNTILEVANAVIIHNPHRNPKKLWSDKKGRNRVLSVLCVSEHQEAHTIVAALSVLPRKKRESVAIVYRAHYQSRALEEALVKHSMPYTIIGGTQFYERKEIKDLLAYLRLLVNPFDRASLFRIINCPQRGLGSKFEALFHERWNLEPFLNFLQISQNLIDERIIIGIKRKSLEKFMSYFKIDPNRPVHEAVQKMIERTRYYAYIRDTYDQNDAQARIDNIQELVHAIDHFTAQGLLTLRQVLDEISLVSDYTTKKQQNVDAHPIQLMTLHAVKGLEFDTVIISGLQEGLLPSARSLTDEEIQEERRLFYVGITRAKEHLLLTHCQYRYRYHSTETYQPSRFLDEIPASHIQQCDGRYFRPYEFKTLFTNWLGIPTTPSSVISFETHAY
jgi:DNA helicase II / ATP-dependent DNA helicase PcrA